MNKTPLTAVWANILLILIFLFPNQLRAQGQPIAPSCSVPKLYINCNAACYQDYLKTQLTFFDFVRDQALADIQVLIIGRLNGGGGQLYSLHFIGQKAFQSLNDTLTFSTRPSDSEAMMREELLTLLKQGLGRYVARTDLRALMRVEFTKREPQEAKAALDPWNYWIFNIQSNISLSGESNWQTTSLYNALSAKRISNASRVSLWGYHSYDYKSFNLNGKTVSQDFASYGWNSRYVKSLTEHWSTGLIYALYHSSYANIQLSQKLAPAIEYNVYPYSANIHKQLRLAYQIGYNPISFMEETIFDRRHQLVPYHKFSVIANFTQIWGNVNASLNTSTFLNDFSYNRLGLDSNLNIRVAQGLSMSISGSASLINDQISLAKSTASDEALLLQSRQLPTSFSYYTNVGLSYTFGSINNSIVNVRLSQID